MLLAYTGVNLLLGYVFLRAIAQLARTGLIKSEKFNAMTVLSIIGMLLALMINFFWLVLFSMIAGIAVTLFASIAEEEQSIW